MQIDWLSAFTVTPPELWPGYESGRTLKLSPHGEILENRLTASQIEHEDENEASSSKNFRVWTPSPGSLYLSGNPVKLLQGHNLFGSMDLLGLYMEAGFFVRSHAGLFPGPSTWEACQFGKPRYTRIDITRSYRFSSDSEALDYIRHVVGSAKSKHGQAKLYGSGTAYFGQNSRRWSMKVYAKKQEMLVGIRGAARNLRGFLFPDELLDWATGVVRFELTLRSPEIKKFTDSPAKLDINSSEALHALWHAYYENIQFNENQAMTQRPDLVESSLDRYLQGTVALWRQGSDLRNLLPKNTYYRHRREILKACGIDISVPPASEVAQETVRTALDPAGWDPEPIASHLVEPRQDLKAQYGLL